MTSGVRTVTTTVQLMTHNAPARVGVVEHDQAHDERQPTLEVAHTLAQGLGARLHDGLRRHMRLVPRQRDERRVGHLQATLEGRKATLNVGRGQVTKYARTVVNLVTHGTLHSMDASQDERPWN